MVPFGKANPRSSSSGAIAERPARWTAVTPLTISADETVTLDLRLLALATLRVPNEELGASTVARLVSRLLQPRSLLRKILVETTVIPGATLTAPPAS